ncbi:MAG: hypothetical protein U9R25_06300 [Chloroflexota bacterium]|nr:hypothetical protein [Chloroflexota bacterium]
MNNPNLRSVSGNLSRREIVSLLILAILSVAVTALLLSTTPAQAIDTVFQSPVSPVESPTASPASEVPTQVPEEQSTPTVTSQSSEQSSAPARKTPPIPVALLAGIMGIIVLVAAGIAISRR